MGPLDTTQGQRQAEDQRRLNQTSRIILQRTSPSSLCYNRHHVPDDHHLTIDAHPLPTHFNPRYHHCSHFSILLMPHRILRPTNNNNNNKSYKNINNKTTKATLSSSRGNIHQVTAIIALLLVFLPAITRVDTTIITKVKIPPYVILGSTVHLYCVFDLQNGTDVYMLKWLKNGEEFYRAVPKAILRPNRRRTFPLEGVKVDIENSKIIPPGNLHQMALQEVQLSTSGKYSCQITLDAPPFQFVSKSGNMTVITIPERFPVISGNKGHQNYRLGERVQLNCTCYDTHPPATLKWFINDQQVPESYLIHYLPSQSSENQGLFHATLGLDFTVEEVHYEHSMYSSKSSKEGDAFSERELWVECEATMPPLGANRTVYPYTRQLFLGSLAQSFNRFDSISASSSGSRVRKIAGSDEFNQLCVLLLNAWLVYDYAKTTNIIYSSLAVISRSSLIQIIRTIITTTVINVFAINSTMLLLLSSILLLLFYNIIRGYHLLEDLL